MENSIRDRVVGLLPSAISYKILPYQSQTFEVFMNMEDAQHIDHVESTCTCISWSSRPGKDDDGNWGTILSFKFSDTSGKSGNAEHRLRQERFVVFFRDGKDDKVMDEDFGTVMLNPEKSLKIIRATAIIDQREIKKEE